MKKIKTMLFGIVFILLGIYGTSMFGASNAGLYVDFLIGLGLFSPYIGLIIFFYGFFKKETIEQNSKTEHNEEEK